MKKSSFFKSGSGSRKAFVSSFQNEKELKELLAEQAYINGVIASDKYVNVSKSIKFMIYSFCSLVVLLVFEFLVM